MITHPLCSKKRALAVILAAILVALVVAITVLTLTSRNSADKSYSKIAISVDVPPCHEFGIEIAKEGGSAMDVAIASLLCAGVASPTSMGLGGGFLMTIVQNGVPYVLDAREEAAAAASRDMFAGNSSMATTGPLSIAVPGELIGYWEAHQKFGKLPWETIMNRAAKLFEDGVVLNDYVASSLKRNEKIILDTPSMKDIFYNPATGKLLQSGELMKRPKLAETVRLIAKEGGLTLNNGSLTKIFSQDILDYGGIITEQDLMNYKPKWREPVMAPLPGGYTLLSVPAPGSGSLLALALQTVAGWIQNLDNELDVHRMVETFKFVFARRTELGDPHGNQTFIDRVRELNTQMTNGEMAAAIRANISDHTSNDTAAYGAKWAPTESHGTLHLAVVTPDTAISVTSSINTLLGSKLASRSTGIILNNQMDDFSLPGVSSYYGVPPSPANFIEPGKRPLSSMVPSIIVGPGNKTRMVVGASGGTKITTTAALIILNNLYFNKSMKATIEERRFHHQLLPMFAMFEDNYPQHIPEGLRKRGHGVSPFSFPSSSAVGISVINDRFTPAADDRRQGVVAGL